MADTSNITNPFESHFQEIVERLTPLAKQKGGISGTWKDVKDDVDDVLSEMLGEIAPHEAWPLSEYAAAKYSVCDVECSSHEEDISSWLRYWLEDKIASADGGTKQDVEARLCLIQRLADFHGEDQILQTLKRIRVDLLSLKNMDPAHPKSQDQAA